MIQCESVQENCDKMQANVEFSLRAKFPERYEQLFQAALLKGEPAVKAWSSYSTNLSLPEIEKDFESEPYLLLPLLYRNLEDHGQSENFPTKYGGVYRYTWTKNQSLIHDAAQTIKLLLNAGIETLILKGAALAITHYQDFGVRPMKDVDVAVKPEKLAATVRVLGKNGWTLRASSQLNREFENAAGNRFDVHWFVGGDDWKRATPVMVQEVPAWTLNATDHLNLISGIYKWSVLWAADTFMLINHSSYPIDWNRLIKCKNDATHMLALRMALHYLSVVLGAYVPQNILTDLTHEKISRRTYLYFVAVVCPAQANSEHPFARLRELWFNYCRIVPSKNFLLSPLEFLLYLRYRWKLNRWWKFPLAAFARLIARLPNLSCAKK